MATPIFFPSTTSNSSLPMLFAGQAQKEFFINQSLTVIDALIPGCLDGSLSTPPVGAVDGACYRILGPATGDWLGKEDQIALRVGGAWQFVLPKDGFRFYDRGAGRLLHYAGTWGEASEPVAPSGGATVDAELRAAFADLVEALRILGVFPNQV